ncbi:ankyrin repeat domain-containing protein [Microbulbifer rhizosphaerae]|uniref:Beta-lactamase regulating signal transducer with metallopeptidase domain/ankyrin repeat protein n=1 Tax=Microbulbifer rhizosphaerae TaxID=1562603 RepID=A0A7W4Z9F3_9GAMM|nr:ankyrin repeat domain-containing protein [Microbulbifer rhizosphaerae]MBB3061526.1 beta-lactamase regulating signal transducer with metallopeptidase domain/ankyrin repeat protein [Microbulbifer rhizosphaerae]
MLFELTLFTTFTLHHLLVGSSLILLLAAATRVLRPSAELQSWLWTTAFAICLLVPFASLVLSAEPTAAERAAKAVWTNMAVQALPVDNVSAAPPETAPRASAAGDKFQWQLPALWVSEASTGLYTFLLIWLLGSAWRLVGVVRSIRRTRRLIRSAVPYRDCGKPLVPCPLLVSASARAPMAAGLLEPVILLPKNFVERFDTERLAPIILHEWAHIQRRDLWVGTLQELAAIVFWWSPVMRLINRKIHISRELACDMRAARALESGKRYAQSLLDCAELMITRRQNLVAMGLFSKKKDLNERINAVLTLKTAKTPKLLTTATACAVFAIASLGAAREYAPRIDLISIKGEALSRAEGERLMEVIRRNDLQALTEMLNSGLDINTPVPGEGTALIEAVRHNRREIAELLIDVGADVNLSSAGDGNPMIAAAWHNRMQLAKLFHQRGADLDAVVPRDGTPLIAAIRSGHDALAEQLIEWGADVNQAAERDGSPMIAAAMTGNLEIAKRLYEKGADINGVVPTDETPLINASHHGHLKMVRFLVESGADVNLGVMANDNEFRTPLNRARNAQVREYLVAMGATK